MNSHDTMSGAELRVARESLGLSQRALSMHIGTSLRSVANYEDGTRPVPADVQEAVIRLSRYTDGIVDGLIASLKGNSEPAVETYRDDEAVPGLWPGMPASWHRAAVARTAKAVPGLRISYAQTAADQT